MTQAAQTSTPTTAWRLDPVHTNVEFAVRHLMISTIYGRFGDVSGTAVAPAMISRERRSKRGSVWLDVSFGGIVTDSYRKRRAGFGATATINRKDFGLGWNQLPETGGVAVGDDVKLLIDAEFIAQPA
jgi:polyisoprenoid-binding protein YceI